VMLSRRGEISRIKGKEEENQRLKYFLGVAGMSGFWGDVGFTCKGKIFKKPNKQPLARQNTTPASCKEPEFQ